MLRPIQGMVEKEQKRFYLEVTSTGMSHRDYFQGSNHHGFSFCGVVGTVIQDLLDLFRRQFPNFEHDRYLNSDLSVYIQGICRLDLSQVNNQLVLEVVCTFLCQNLRDSQSWDHLQIFANFHLLLNDAQRMRE
jgi:hypothetical protein